MESALDAERNISQISSNFSKRLTKMWMEKIFHQNPDFLLFNNIPLISKSDIRWFEKFVLFLCGVQLLSCEEKMKKPLTLLCLFPVEFLLILNESLCRAVPHFPQLCSFHATK